MELSLVCYDVTSCDMYLLASRQGMKRDAIQVPNLVMTNSLLLNIAIDSIDLGFFLIRHGDLPPSCIRGSYDIP